MKLHRSAKSSKLNAYVDVMVVYSQHIFVQVWWLDCQHIYIVM